MIVLPPPVIDAVGLASKALYVLPSLMYATTVEALTNDAPLIVAAGLLAFVVLVSLTTYVVLYEGEETVEPGSLKVSTAEYGNL